MIVRCIYRIVLWLAFPLIWLYLLKRSKKQPEYRQHWAERLGFYPLPLTPHASRLTAYVQFGCTRYRSVKCAPAYR